MICGKYSVSPGSGVAANHVVDLLGLNDDFPRPVFARGEGLPAFLSVVLRQSGRQLEFNIKALPVMRILIDLYLWEVCGGDIGGDGHFPNSADF